MKVPTATQIKTVLELATKWLSVSDINTFVNSSRSRIRRCLRRDPAYKSEKVPGDPHGSRQWALRATDTTGWANAASSRSSTKTSLTTGRLSTKTPLQSTPPRPLGSYNYKGLILMCAPVNKPSLIETVGDLLLAEFVTSGKRFSAYDVTKRLRELVLLEAKNLGRSVLLDPNELGTVMVQGLKVPKIDHEDVKSVVHDIFNAGGMPNLGRIHANGHWEYDTKAKIDALLAPSQAPSAPVTTGSTTDPDPVSGGTMGSTYDGSSTI